jgi:TctA family transporter
LIYTLRRSRSGFVLGPRFEENFRRSLLISRGDLMTFIERPISAFFLPIGMLPPDWHAADRGPD